MLEWCRCAEPSRDPEDEEAFCWRCGKQIEALDRDTGERLNRAEDDEDDY